MYTTQSVIFIVSPLFPLLFMRKLYTPFIVLSLMMLSACQTSSLSETEKAPVPESNTVFSGKSHEIDKSQSVLSFTEKSNVINHEGKFNTYTATVTLDSAEPANLEKASIEAEIDITSVEIDAAGLQAHLAKADFFDVAQFPAATFTSSKIVHISGNAYDVTGDLTIKGIAKTVTVRTEITDDYLSAKYDLPRKDFGIGNDSYGSKLLEPLVPVNVKFVFQK